MKKSIAIFIAFCLPLLAMAVSDPSGIWTRHHSAGTGINRMFATPAYLYYLTLNQPVYENVAENATPWSTLHRWDRNAAELQTLNEASGLSSDLPVFAEYNPDRKYLLLGYNDGMIDLLFDNGEIKHVNGLKNADDLSKQINSVTFDAAENRAYVATGFGYFAINDKKGEIAESRLYRLPLRSVARQGDWFMAVDSEGNLHRAPMSSPRMSWSDFTPMQTGKEIFQLLPLGGSQAAALARERSAVILMLADPQSGEVTEKRTMYNVSWHAIPGGWFVGSGSRALEIRPDGSYDIIVIPTPEGDNPSVMASSDMRTFWFATPQEGFHNRKLSKAPAGDTWGKASQPVKPHGPKPFLATDLAYSPNYGFLVPNHGINNFFPSQAYPEPLLLSGLKDGGWTQYGLPDRAPEQSAAFANPNGIAIDPDSPNLVYMGSVLHGLLRLNLDNPHEVLHLSRPDDQWKDLPGFVKVHDELPDWKRLSQINNPAFDAAGNLWCVFNNYGAANGAQLWVWTADDRRASKSASSFRPMHKMAVKGCGGIMGSGAEVLPLRHASNQNIVVYSDKNANGNIYVIYHNGTFANQADDRTYKLSLSGLTDSEGAVVEAAYALCMYEDTETGNVWVGTDSGVFTFSPANAVGANNPMVRQYKISRDDGTGLADYLLSGVQVNDITADSRNRKWISTKGAGLVCVGADGREIITSCTTENSDIPSDIVYTTLFPANTSTMLVATERGLAGYQPYNVGDGTDFEHIRAYPNPVRPDYLGYVTIDGLADNALVKIADANGHMVRELGFAANGLVRWDVADYTHRRVGSGVYFVLASTGPDDDSLSKVAKILVIN